MGDKTKGLGHEIESPKSMLKPPNSNLKNYVYHFFKKKEKSCNIISQSLYLPDYYFVNSELCYN